MIIRKIWLHLRVVCDAWIFAVVNLIWFLFRPTTSFPTLSDEEITVVLTCCDRNHYLEKTLKSFLKFNTHKQLKFIVIEDGGNRGSYDICKKHLDNNYEWQYIFNEVNLGQLVSIDLAYSRCLSDYVFHLEEDWEFVAPGFIEESLHYLNKYPQCLFVSLRKFDDQNGHPIVASSICSDMLTFKSFWKGCWTGFGFNASLRRMADYKKLKNGYSLKNTREVGPGIFYKLLGFEILTFADKKFVNHLGENGSTGPTHKKA